MHMDVVETRHRNLLVLLTDLERRGATRGVDQAQRLGGMNPSYLSQLKGGKKMGDDVARKIELAASRPRGWMDQPQWTGTESVSRSDATLVDAHQTGIKRVRIEGAVVMEENGFWTVGDDEAEEASYPTDDPDAYAIRVTSQRFKPVVSLAQCILVSPRSPVKPGRPVVVTMSDGRKTLRTFISREAGVWNLANVNDANDYLDLSDTEVAKVERVMAYLWTD